MTKATQDLSLSREALVGLASKIVMMALGFAGTVVFANVLGPVGLGTFYIVMTIGQLLTQVANGISRAIRKRISEINTDPGEFLGLALLSHAAFLIVLVTALLSTEWLINRYIEAPQLTVSVTIIVLGLGLFTLGNQFLSGIGYPGYASWFDTLRSLLTLLLQVGLLLNGFGPFGLIVGFAVAGLLSGVVVVLYARQRPRVPSGETIRQTASFARWSVPDAFVGSTFFRVPTLVIGAFVGNAAVGFYESAFRLVQPASMFTASISNPLHVKVSGRSSANLDVIPDLKNAVSYAGMIGIPMVFGALVLSQELMRTVFGADFAEGWPLLVGLAVYQLFNVLNSPLSSTVTGLDKIDSEFRITLLTASVNTVLALVFGWFYGAVGVVIGMILTEFGRFVIYQYFLHGSLGSVALTRPMAEQALSAAVMGGIVWFLSTYVLPVRSWLYLLAVVGIGAAIYGVVLFVVSDHLRMTIGNVLEETPLEDWT
jgi:O-antigen/teichoic acid export membrane protein